ncbi:hypothetical protein Tco_0752970, partial [Tanacetum coccineum]
FSILSGESWYEMFDSSRTGVHAYYNGSRISKDTEDPSWSTSFKTRRTRKTSSALEALWKHALEDFICVVFIHDRNINALSAFNAKMKIELLSNPSKAVAPKLMKKLANIYFTHISQTSQSTFSLSTRKIALWKSQMEDHTSNWLRVVTISGLGQTINACFRVFAGDIYGDIAVLCAGIVGIKHQHNLVCNTLIDICFRSEISAGKEVDIGLGGGQDKPLRPADMLLYLWDIGLDVFVDLTGSSPWDG